MIKGIKQIEREVKEIKEEILKREEYEITKGVLWLNCKKEETDNFGRYVADFKVIPIAINGEIENENITCFKNIKSGKVYDLKFLGKNPKNKFKPNNWDFSQILKDNFETENYSIECLTSTEFLDKTILKMNGLYNKTYDKSGDVLFYRSFGIDHDITKDENKVISQIEINLQTALADTNLNKLCLSTEKTAMAKAIDICELANTTQENILRAYKLNHSKQKRQAQEKQKLNERISFSKSF